MEKKFESIKELIKKQIETIDEYIDKTLYSNESVLYIILKTNTESLIKSSFEKTIYEKLLESEDVNDLISQIEFYMNTIEQQTYHNIMPSTTSIMRNISMVWQMEVLFSMKKKFELWVKELK